MKNAILIGMFLAGHVAIAATAVADYPVINLVVGSASKGYRAECTIRNSIVTVRTSEGLFSETRRNTNPQRLIEAIRAAQEENVYRADHRVARNPSVSITASIFPSLPP